jgi:hypothetical protein
MMRVMRQIVVTLGLVAAVVVGSAMPATAWFGDVHVTHNNYYQYGGWIDGNGPDSYQAYANCNGGYTAYGTERWAGDRSGSIAYCPNRINGKVGFIYFSQGVVRQQSIQD